MYDYSSFNLVQGLNDWAHVTGGGAFHAAVEVYGAEWSFCRTGEGDGIYCNPPKGNKFHMYRETIPMGLTFKSIQQVEQLIEDMAKDYSGQSYDLLWKNCCHFSDDFCKRLGVGHVPAWINPTLARRQH